MTARGAASLCHGHVTLQCVGQTVCPLPVDGHSHCFHLLAAVNPAAISVDKFLCGHESVGPHGDTVFNLLTV